MGKAHLDLQELQEMIVYIANNMIESKDQLTQADKAIGDGDHGVGMARGFEAVIRKVESEDITSIEQFFKTVGMALLTSIGGAAGAVFGTLFRGGSKLLKEKEVFDAEALSLMISGGLEAVKKRGCAKPGDKTMIDALEPATLEAKNQESSSLEESLKAVTEEARLGMEKTKEMVAKVGKAKTLGERSRGYPDPGSISTYLILKFMAEYVSGEKG
jgi:dihydroxyacetone kinase-like protein